MNQLMMPHKSTAEVDTVFVLVVVAAVLAAAAAAVASVGGGRTLPDSADCMRFVLGSQRCSWHDRNRSMLR